MKKYNKKINILFFIGITLIEIRFFLNISQIFNVNSHILDIVLLFAYLFLVLKILLANEKIKNLIFYFFILILGVGVYYKTSQPSVVTLFLVVISAKNIEIKKIVKYLLILNSINLAIHVCLYIIYYVFQLDALKIVLRRVNGKVIQRYSFFIGHPNTFSAFFFWTFMMYLYVYYEKIDAKTYLYIILSMIYIYIYPNSKTTVIGFAIALILISRKYDTERSKKFFFKIIKILPVFACIFSLVSIVFFDNRIIQIIDKLFTGRIMVARGLYEYYGVHLFGSNISEHAIFFFINNKQINNINSVDGSYYSMLINSGIIGLILYAVFIQQSFNRLIKAEKIKEIIFLSICIIFGLLETSCINPLLAFPLLFINKMYEKEEKEDESKGIYNYTNL